MDVVGAGLDLQLAWRRVLSDSSGRVFIVSPFETDLVLADLPGWLTKLADLLHSDTYNPQAPRFSDVPKGRATIRPGAHVPLQDQTIYAAAVGACLPAIYHFVAPNQGVTEFSYPINKSVKAVAWLANPFLSWTNFRKASLAGMGPETPYVVITDISSYYDNIDITTLLSDLRAITCPPAAIGLLSKCLNRWAMVTGRGIPQGYSASDVLQKVYLHSVDMRLRAAGFHHVRYVDDFRIFCRTRAESQRAVMFLARLLRERGLQLQTAKTQILTTNDARVIIEGIAPVVGDVQRNFLDSARQVLGAVNEYLSVAAADRMLSSATDDAPLGVIRDTFKAYFLEGADEDFNSTLFHFLLNRLGKHGDDYARHYGLGLLISHPEETKSLLTYFERVGGLHDVEDHLVGFLRSEDCTYPYQEYQLLTWVLRNEYEPGEGLLEVIRTMAFSRDVEWYVKATARALLGRWGTLADLEELERAYSGTTDPLEQAGLLCCLQRMEVGRRNSFFGRALADGDLQKRAVVVAKRGV